MPGFLHQHAKPVAPVQRRLALTHLVLIQLKPAYADRGADSEGHRLGFERGAVRVDVHQAPLLDQVAHPGLFREIAVQLRGIKQQRPQAPGRHGRRAPPSTRRPNSAAAKAPRAAGAASGSRAARADRPGSEAASAHVPRPGRRDHRHGREPAPVAVAGRLLAAGFARLDDRDPLPVAHQFERGRRPHRARADDGDMPTQTAARLYRQPFGLTGTRAGLVGRRNAQRLRLRPHAKNDSDAGRPVRAADIRQPGSAASSRCATTGSGSPSGPRRRCPRSGASRRRGGT